MDSRRLPDKVAIVTGAGSGFGEGIARRFAAEGATVLVNDINLREGERVASEIRAAGGAAIFCAGDVSLDADVAALVHAALAGYGRVDVNVKSLYLTARHAVPAMRRQGGGAFITIASTAGVRPRPGLTWYNGSKGAAIVTSRSMAAELAPDRIRVNVINPVAGETGLLAEFMGGDTPELRAKFVATIPMGRLSLPSDVATAAVFFASDEAGFITGACLEVDGGRCI